MITRMRADRGEFQMRRNKAAEISMQIRLSQRIFPDLESRADRARF